MIVIITALKFHSELMRRVFMFSPVLQPGPIIILTQKDQFLFLHR